VPAGGAEPLLDGRLHAADARERADARPGLVAVLGGEEEGGTRGEKEIGELAEPVLKRSTSIYGDGGAFNRNAFEQHDAKVVAEPTLA
jgi:hypothetical protein